MNNRLETRDKVKDRNNTYMTRKKELNQNKEIKGYTGDKAKCKRDKRKDIK